jgi:3-deoxy-D-arabino-heptulosonate 7-phosphate (DAHP) synthase class II
MRYTIGTSLLLFARVHNFLANLPGLIRTVQREGKVVLSAFDPVHGVNCKSMEYYHYLRLYYIREEIHY